MLLHFYSILNNLEIIDDVLWLSKKNHAKFQSAVEKKGFTLLYWFRNESIFKGLKLNTIYLCVTILQFNSFFV